MEINRQKFVKIVEKIIKFMKFKLDLTFIKFANFLLYVAGPFAIEREEISEKTEFTLYAK